MDLLQRDDGTFMPVGAHLPPRNKNMARVTLHQLNISELEDQLSVLRRNIELTEDPLRRLHLIQQRINTEKKLAKMRRR